MPSRFKLLIAKETVVISLNDNRITCMVKSGNRIEKLIDYLLLYLSTATPVISLKSSFQIQLWRFFMPFFSWQPLLLKWP